MTVSLSALLCSSIPLLSPQACQNPVVCHSLKIWSVPKTLWASLHVGLFPCHSSSLLDNAFSLWQKYGVLHIKMPHRDGIFMSFDQVREKFSLPAHNFIRYLQVRHFIKNHFTQFPSIPPKSPLDSILETPSEVKGTVSWLYTTIFEMEDSSLPIIKDQLKKDMDTNITEEQWYDILQRIQFSSWLIQFKIAHSHNHMSKVKLSKIFPDVNPICDRCKQAPATLSHKFWSCPRITAFWSSSLFSSLFSSFWSYHSPMPLHWTLWCINK